MRYTRGGLRVAPFVFGGNVRTVIIAYNEARMLPMCLAHIPHGSPVTVVDGAYADYPHDEPYSTDGTLDIARRWGADVVEVTEPWRDQMHKRTAALTPGVCFCPDADEMLLTAMPELPDGVDVGWVTCHSPVYRDPFLMPRVFRVREGWHYAGRHHWLYDAQKRLVCSGSYAGRDYKHAILPVTLINARDMREDTRDAEKVAYIRARNPHEQAYSDEQSVYPRPQKRKR